MANSTAQRKDILVTGASGVIGGAIARQLASAGFNLHLTSRDTSRLDKLSQECISLGASVSTYTLDLSDRVRCNGLVDEYFQKAKNPFGLVCNAGDLGVLGAFLETDMKDWIRSLEQNFIAHAVMLRAFGRNHIAKKQAEAAVVVLSGAGLGSAPTPNLSSYGTSKAALTYLAEALSLEWASFNITINAIAPGQVKSGITDQAIQAGAERVGAYAVSAQKCKETGGVSPELGAQLVEFLMTPAARKITGRLLSARFDQKRLRENPQGVADDRDLYRLRRIDQDLFGASQGTKR